MDANIEKIEKNIIIKLGSIIYGFVIPLLASLGSVFTWLIYMETFDKILVLVLVPAFSMLIYVIRDIELAQRKMRDVILENIANQTNINRNIEAQIAWLEKHIDRPINYFSEYENFKKDYLLKKYGTIN